MTIPELALRKIRFRCLTNVHAVQFRNHLQRRGVLVDDVETTDVVISCTGDLDFVSTIATEGVLGNYADPEAMTDLIDGAKAAVEVEDLLAVI